MSTTEGQASLAHIAVSDEFVYWVESGGFFRAPKGGGPRDSLFSDGASVRRLAVTPDNQVYFLNSAGLQRARETPFFGWGLKLLDPRAMAFTLDATRVYWATRAEDSDAVEIRSLALDETDPILHATVDATGMPVIEQLAVDAANLYWQERRSGAGGSGPIVRLPRGGSAQAITSNISQTTGLLSDGSYLFWGTGTAIFRLPVGSMAIATDLVADHIEVIQAVQGVDNDVPLVQGKITHARFFARGGGQRGVAAMLVGTKNGQPLPDSPLLPFPDNEDLSGPLRATGDFSRDGFLFRLPESWTGPGQISLVGTVNPQHVTLETDYTNNSAATTIRFADKAPICMVVVPLRTTSGTTGSHYPALDPVILRAEALLPTPELRVFFPGGSPLEEYEFPFSLGPYEFSESDDDSASILTKLFLRNEFGDDPDSCDAVDARTHHVAIVPGDHPNRALNGSAVGDAVVFVAREGDDGFPINSAVGGVTLAHELGHNYGRDHVNCPRGVPDGIDSDYPYRFGIDTVGACSIDNPETVSPGTQSFEDAHVGFDPVGRFFQRPRKMVFDADLAGDLMSYAHFVGKPRWPSDYTWKAIAGEIDNVPRARLVNFVLPDEPTWVVTGVLQANGEVEFSHAYEVDAQVFANFEQFLSRGTDRAGFELWMYDGSGAQLSRVPLVVLENVEDRDGAATFVALVSSATQLARIEVVDTGGGTPVTLGALAAGSSPPLVTIASPAGGTVIDDALTITWDSSDPDGDQLRFIVRYSADGGGTWQVLVPDTLVTEFVVPSRGLPGADGSAIVQVIASDGLHTTTATSAPFTVRAKPPEASYSIQTAAGLEPAQDLAVPFGEAIALHGRGYDDEDGPLTDAAFEWAVAGPLDHAGTGRRLSLPDLVPGVYEVDLFVTDSDGNTTEASGTLGIDPKFIADGDALVLDGMCDDQYSTDESPLRLRYANGDTAEARFVHSTGALFVCVNGLPIGSDAADERVQLLVDVDASGGPDVVGGDVGFVIAVDGIGSVLRAGGAGGFVPEELPVGVDVRVARTDLSWGAEVRIDEDLLGGWNHAAAIRVSHDGSAVMGGGTRWPPNSIAGTPDTWGAVVFRQDSCVGDCNNDSVVTIDELIRIVNVALGISDIGSCGSGDANGDREISVNEAVTAVRNALEGCLP